jgi:hypothetical protein
MSNDTFLGTNDADLFQQSLADMQGSDTYYGFEDDDTVDYLNLNAGITLKRVRVTF